MSCNEKDKRIRWGVGHKMTINAKEQMCECGHPKEMDKDKKNLISLIMGIVLMIIGLTWTSITIHISYKYLIVSAIILISGAFFSLYGGLGKWN